MHARHAVAGVLAAAAVAGSLACGRASALDPDLPAIVARSIAYHGGSLYASSRMSMTISSLSGSFGIEAMRDGSAFEYVVTNPARGDRPERRVRLTNDGVTEWIGRWKANGWQTASKTPVKNRDLWERLDSVAGPHDVEWVWVKGHSGHADNERVDRAANAAIDDMLRESAQNARS